MVLERFFLFKRFKYKFYDFIKYKTTLAKLSLGIITHGLFIAILGISVITSAFADEGWIIVETDKTEYSTGQSLVVTGFILERKMPIIAMSVYDPNGMILSANSVELQEDNSFSKTISLDSPFYDKTGIYLIDFDYGKKTEQITFEIISAQNPEDVTLPDIVPEVIFVETDKESYQDNELITISGMVSTLNDPTVLVGIYDPSGMPAGFYTPTINSNLEFTVSFLAKNGVNFKAAGKYTVKAHYGESKYETGFEFVIPKVPHPDMSVPEKQEEPIVKPVVEKPSTDIVNVSPPQKSLPETKIVEPEPKSPIAETTPKPKQEEANSDGLDNLSVEDIELGKMLNEIKLNCDTSEYLDSIAYYDGMGPALMRLCNYEQAISYFDQSLVYEPYNVEIITNKGSAFGKLGQHDVAIANYNMALEIDPTYLPALNNKANILAKQEKFEEAATIYSFVLELDPSYTVAAINLQKLKERLAETESVDQKASLQQVKPTLPIMEEPIKTEMAGADTTENASPNILEQIGSIFASFFGFIK